LREDQTRDKSLITLPLLLVLVSAALLNTPNLLIKYGDAQAQETQAVIKIVPPTDTILVSSSTTINVTVTNVVNLFAWGVEIFFDQAVVDTNETSVWLPSDHIFAGQDIVGGLSATVEAYPSGRPLYPRKYLYYGASLLPPQMGGGTPFNGSGTLFQVNFKGVGLGTSFLNMTEDPPGIFGVDLLDFNENPIPFTMQNGRVAVLSPEPGEKAYSEISINVEPDTVTIGSDVTISGKIVTNETKTGASVTLYYSASGGAWGNLTTVKTGADSRFTHVWKTTQTGTYQVKAKWEGDAKTNGSESPTKTFTVKESEPTTPDITLYVIVAVAAIIVVAILVYFVKFRKR